MGYRSEVALCVHAAHKTALMADPGIAQALADADTKLEDDDGLLFHWGWVKWYAFDKGIQDLMWFLSGIVNSDDYLFIRIGEDDSDTDIRGGWWDNPFDMGYARRIEFCNPPTSPAQTQIVDLKRLNTRAGAINCARCGEVLSDPGMGPAYKHCPRCEP